MKSRIINITFSLLLLLISISFSQNPEWVLYSNVSEVNSLAFEGNFIWIGTEGGLVQINKTSGLKTFYNIANSGLPNNSVGSITIDNLGNKWLISWDLVKYDGTNWTVYTSMHFGLPNKYFLSQNHPNPFNPITAISWHLAVGSEVDLSVYNLLGQKVATLVSQRLPAGYHEVEFNGQNLSSGIYLYRIEVGAWIDVKKMTLIR